MVKCLRIGAFISRQRILNVLNIVKYRGEWLQMNKSRHTFTLRINHELANLIKERAFDANLSSNQLMEFILERSLDHLGTRKSSLRKPQKNRSLK